MKCHVGLLCIFLSAFVIQNCAGLRCWTCDNQPTMFHCMFRGAWKTCLVNQESCLTLVRRCGPKFAITKACKQARACLVQSRNQITPDVNGITECNTDQESSACTCCCNGDDCNLNSNACRGMSFDCLPRESLLNGEVDCTKNNETGSVCDYRCTTPGYFLFPFENQESTCLQRGEWSRPLPCCARSCPDFLYNDILFMRQANNVEAWEEFQSKLISTVGQFTLRNDSSRVGVLSYGSKVHSDLAIYLPEFMENLDGFLEKVSTLPYTVDEDAVLTGAALTYVLENYFVPERGDRLNVRNVIILQADNTSADDVLEIANTLRERGFETYAVGSNLNTDPDYRRQLLEIAGSEERLFFEEDPADMLYIEDLIFHLCRNPCDHLPSQFGVPTTPTEVVFGNVFTDEPTPGPL